MYISALYRMLRSRTFKRTATSDEHARKFRIWRSLVLIDISKLMSLNSVVLVITQLNSFYVFSFGWCTPQKPPDVVMRPFCSF